MKTKRGVLAAAIAAVVTSIGFFSANTYAEQLTSIQDPALLDALTNAEYYLGEEYDWRSIAAPTKVEIGTDEQGDPIYALDFVSEIDDIEQIEFDCFYDNPIEGVQSWEGFSDFAEVREITFCTPDNIDWDELAKMEYLNFLDIFPYYRYDEMEEAAGYMSNIDAVHDYLDTLPKSDISGISKLDLVGLQIALAPIKDTSELERLTNLQYLSLIYGRIEDVSFLDNLTKLTNSSSLDLSFNTISNPEPVLSWCIRSGNCTEGTWDEMIDDYYLSDIIGHNKATITVNSESFELPAYAKAYADEAYSKYDWFAEDLPTKKGGNVKGGRGGSDSQAVLDRMFVTDGLTYSHDTNMITLDMNSNTHSLRIMNTNDEPVQILYFNYVGSEEADDDGMDNPETSAKDPVALAAGIAVAVILGFSLWNGVKARR